MRSVLLWVLLVSIALASGIAVLANTIDIKSQQMGVFFTPCEDIDAFKDPLHLKNCREPITVSAKQLDNNTVESTANPWAAQRAYSAMVVANNFDSSQGNDDKLVRDSTNNLIDSNLENGNQGCPVSFWIKESDYRNVTDSRLLWPPSYLPEDKFGSPAYFNTKLTISSIDDPSLIDALNSQNDGIEKLARQSVAALLNAAHSKIHYPLTITQVISLTNDAIAKSDYSVAETFAKYNNLDNSELCS